MREARVVRARRNIYVNPAWNLGVEESKENAICLLGDDVTIDLFCLPIMLEKLGEGGALVFTLKVTYSGRRRQSFL